MIRALINFVIAVIVVAVLYYIITLIPLPPHFRPIVNVLFIVICLIGVVYFLLDLRGRNLSA